MATEPVWVNVAGALRELAPCESVPPGLRPLMLQAAAEIEQLRRALQAADRMAHDFVPLMLQAAAEIEQLRRALQAADRMARDFVFSPLMERYWLARGGHDACTVCNGN